MLEFPLSGEKLNLKSSETLSHSCAIAIWEGKNSTPYLGVFGTTGSSTGGGQDWIGKLGMAVTGF